MALAIGDIIEIKAVQTLLTNMLLNVFHYEVMEFGNLVGYDDILTNFDANVGAQVRGAQSSALSWQTLYLRNLTNGIDIAELAVNTAGGQTGDVMPSFVAYAFRLNRTSGVTRHGQKRFGGVPESAVTNEGIVGGLAATVNGIATELQSVLEVDAGNENDFILRPVIVGRTEIGDTGVYELDLTKINPVASAQYIRISSQVTRRTGRGI